MKEQIDARELTHDLMPKLKATRHFIESSLKVRIEACQDEAERQRLIGMQQEFELEMLMIQMNLDNLLKRYSDLLLAVAEGKQKFTTPLLDLDQSESVAIESARQLYYRAHRHQAG